MAVGDNPQRLRSEASFAALAGTAPVPIRSGHSNHHRLSRGGDRALNRAIHTIVMVRKRRDATTRAYIQAHTAKGMTNRDITRRLKRAVARNLHHALKQALNNPTYHPTTLTPTT
ncbi:transposase [Actinomyces denticolens]|uniref:transposase n=1 Tax=Actinomyces denticolens TaxID=52767 RepID=UPI0035311B43